MTNQLFRGVSSVLYQNRYCSQEDFYIIIDGTKSRIQGGNIRNIYKVKYPNVDEILDSFLKFSYSDLTVASGINIWTRCDQGTVSEDLNSVYISFRNSVATNGLTYNLFQIPDKRINFCACSFMKHLYILGGYASEGGALRTCLKYDTRDGSWSDISNMNYRRVHSACTVFVGKIVVSGGLNAVGVNNDAELSSVEAHDHVQNKWSNLPEMINGRYIHGAVSRGNKMFVIGGCNRLTRTRRLTCEVFDSSSRKFTNIKQMVNIDAIGMASTSVVSIGKNIFVFRSIYNYMVENVQIYNVPENEWCLGDISIDELNYMNSCSKVPVV